MDGHGDHPVTRGKSFRDLELGLLIRVAFYWLTLLGYFAAMLLISGWVDAPRHTAPTDILSAWISECVLWLPASLVILPLAILDFTRFFGRFSRCNDALRTQLADLARGGIGKPLDPKDFEGSQETVNAFNEVRDQLLRMRQ